MNRRLYNVAVVGLMLTLMGVVMGIASPGLSDTDLGVVDSKMHLPVVLATALVYLVVLSRLVTEPDRILRSIGAMKAFYPILLFCVVSSVWSSDPLLTVRRALFMFLTILVGIILGTDFEIQELARLFAIASVIHILACAVLLVAAPHLLYSPSDVHAMKGLTTHKNIFGLEQGLALITFLFVPFRSYRRLRWPLVLAAGAFLIMSHSTGSLIATLCAIAILPLLQIFRFPGPARIPLLLLSVVLVTGVGFFLVENASALPALFSKDATLTGRTQLWDLVKIAIAQQPLLGYGFDSFWQGLQGPSLAIIRGVGWLVPTAHNGYLDLLLGMGWVGAALFAPAMLQGILRALRYVIAERSSARYYPICFIVFWLVYNLNESALVTRTGIPFLFFIAMSTILAPQLVTKRASAYEPSGLAYPDPYTLTHGLPPY